MLITGVSGLLGNNLTHYFKNKFEVTGTYLKHPLRCNGVHTQRLDLTVGAETRIFIDTLNPDFIIHCAAFTDIEACETDRELAQRVNVLATKNLVDAVAGSAGKIIYISTDAVYDGTKGKYTEADTPHPLNAYGQTKLEGEFEALHRPESLVLRTNIFGWNVQPKESIAEWMVRSFSQRIPFKGFTDVVFSSMYTFELASILESLIAISARGIYNCSSRDSLSKYEFAIQIAKIFGFDDSLVTPSSIENSNLKAARGKNLSLDVSKLTSVLGKVGPSVLDSINHFYRDYTVGLPAILKGKK